MEPNLYESRIHANVDFSKMDDLRNERENLCKTIDLNDPNIEINSKPIYDKISVIQAQIDEIWTQILANKITLRLENNKDICFHKYDPLLEQVHRKVTEQIKLNNLPFLCGYIYDQKCNLQIFPREIIEAIFNSPLLDFKNFKNNSIMIK
jgi:hypothetical protein